MTTSPVGPMHCEDAPPAHSEAAAASATTAGCGKPELASARPTWRAYVPAAAGATYLAAWAVGLAVWPVNLSLDAPAAQVAASHRAQPVEAVSQYLLVEGLAGVLLGVVLASALLPLLARRRGRAGISGWGIIGLAATAVLTSLSQCVLGLLVTAAATGHDRARCGTLFALVNRLDGVKMIALAAVTALVVAVASPAPPRWLRAVTVPLGLALVASGYAYLTLSGDLAWTAFVSGPLLLLWVTGMGFVLTARRRVHRPLPR